MRDGFLLCVVLRGEPHAFSFRQRGRKEGKNFTKTGVCRGALETKCLLTRPGYSLRPEILSIKYVVFARLVWRTVFVAFKKSAKGVGTHLKAQIWTGARTLG